MPVRGSARIRSESDLSPDLRAILQRSTAAPRGHVATHRFVQPMMSLFDDEDETPYVPPPKKVPSDDFWRALHGIRDGEENGLGAILIDAELNSGGLNDPGKNNHGLRYIEAIGSGGGPFSLTCSWDKKNHAAVASYFLPYMKGETVYAKRSWYENSICDYFVTVQLSGCRFVLTDTHVLHIASDAGRANPLQSDVRTTQERLVTGGIGKTRRYSITDQDKGYGFPLKEERTVRGRGLVFGMRTVNGWVYKALKTTPGSSEGTWSILVPE
ncbi:MAG: hypothetical protein Q8Q09_25940 [Deltaproteobacteria bacterium]|nr:hypothetical protein [Deltaproteobacteria bacterium]